MGWRVAALNSRIICPKHIPRYTSAVATRSYSVMKLPLCDFIVISKDPLLLRLVWIVSCHLSLGLASNISSGRSLVRTCIEQQRRHNVSRNLIFLMLPNPIPSPPHSPTPQVESPGGPLQSQLQLSKKPVPGLPHCPTCTSYSLQHNILVAPVLLYTLE